MARLLILAVGVIFPAFLLAQEGGASLAGKARDITGAGVVGADIELVAATPPFEGHRTQTDSSGVFRFSGLPADDYTLMLRGFGFKILSVRSIRVDNEEHESLPDLELDVAMLSCGGIGVLDHLRALQTEARLGNLVGSVKTDTGSRPVDNAEVKLTCNTDTPCGETKTDLKGEFTFRHLAGYFTIQVNHQGFYPKEEPGFRIQGGYESSYWPIFLERCPRGNCDAKRRLKKPIGTCE